MSRSGGCLPAYTPWPTLAAMHLLFGITTTSTVLALSIPRVYTYTRPPPTTRHGNADAALQSVSPQLDQSQSVLSSMLYTNRDMYFQGRDTTFVHVGKTGGSTLEKRLRRCCNPKHGRLHVVHKQPLTLTNGPANQSIVVSIREPVARIVSAFNYRRHYNARTVLHCSQEFKARPEYKLKTHRFDCSTGQAPPLETALFACYADMNEFAEGLFESTGAHMQANQTCRDIAHTVLAQHVNHIGEGLTFYLNTRVNFTALQHQIFAVRTEHLDSDFCLYAFLRSGATFDESDAYVRTCLLLNCSTLSFSCTAVGLCRVSVQWT